MTELNRINDDDQQARAQRRNRMQMIVIMLVAFISLGGSYAMYYFAKNSGGWGTTNNGAFVEPPTTIEQLGWKVDGEVRKWWVWTVSGKCGATCQDTVQKMRALHVLLNREGDRVRRGHTGDEVQPDWMAQYPALAQVGIAHRESIDDGIYIVDPNGNLVFFYAMDTDPKLVLQDLKKLLKVSQIG